MLLSSLLQNGTLANLDEWKKSCQKLEEWKESCQLHVMAVSNWHNQLTLGGSPELNQALIVLVNKVNEFSIDGMDEFLNRRLREPLAIAKSNCATLEYNNKELAHLLSELRVIATEIPSRFRMVIMMVKVELIDKTSCPTWEEFETSRQKWEKLKTSHQKWEEWVTACQQHVKTVSNLHNKLTLDNLSNVTDIYEALHALQKKVYEVPIKGMEEIWNHRLEAPLNKEFNTFSVEVELELIKKVKWTSESKTELENKFLNLYELSQHNESYFNPRPSLWLAESEEVPHNQKQFVDYVETHILDAKLSILETELPAKIAFFAEKHPHIDGDRFLEFSEYFKLELHKFEQKIDQHKSLDENEHYRKRLNDLAESAMKETAPLKGIIIQNLDQLTMQISHVLNWKRLLSKTRKWSYKHINWTKFDRRMKESM
uniref:Dynein heavy chain linker domain-containing protein n=1 Tax=Globodera rostochiensis TaxID=31243 RepID=A0A914HKC4_GLORO